MTAKAPLPSTMATVVGSGLVAVGSVVVFGGSATSTFRALLDHRLLSTRCPRQSVVCGLTFDVIVVVFAVVPVVVVVVLVVNFDDGDNGDDDDC